MTPPPLIIPAGAGYYVLDLDQLVGLLDEDQRSYLTNKLLEKLKTEIRELADELNDQADELARH